jgi:hypothetical protein
LQFVWTGIDLNQRIVEMQGRGLNYFSSSLGSPFAASAVLKFWVQSVPDPPVRNLNVKQRPILITFNVCFTSLHRQINIKKQCTNNYLCSILTLFTGECWTLIDMPRATPVA